MKKIININLSGRVIPIEDSAYGKLQTYIESLRRYFANEDGRDEIINDIESRIAELMNEKIRLGSSCITETDVNEIISSMGTVEDFEAVENEKTASAPVSPASSFQQSSTNTGDTYTKKEKGRLYRDSSDKLLGGVCAGIANYLNIDPAVVRILFAIITFGGFGLGVLAYILLWIILPPKDLEGYFGKRLYRNPEEKVIGGVASGLAAYFGKTATTIRLVFAAPVLLNIIFRIISNPFYHSGSFFPNIVFGSLTGTFILAYIVLWIVLPEAQSQYQKMEMRGEKVDVNTIRQNVKEGMENMKGKVKDWSEEVKDSAQNLSNKAKEFANTRGKTFAAEVSQKARSGGQGIGHIFGVIFKAFFLFIAGSIAFGLFVALIGLLIGGVGVWPLKDFILDGFWQNTYAWGTLILFLGVPLIGFIIWLLRRIMGVKSKGNYLGWTFGGLWTLGWVSVSLLAASLFNDFRMSNNRTEGSEMNITQPANGRMIVTVQEPEVEYSGSIPWLDMEGNGVDMTTDTFKLANVKIRIEQSKDANYHVEIKKYSRGRTVSDAEDKAQQIVFHTTYSDSILNVGSGVAISNKTKFRGQQAIVLIKVPTGKKIMFNESIDKLHSFNIRINDNRRWDRSGRKFDIDQGEDFDYKTGVDYTMSVDGLLKDPTGSSLTKPNNDYRYENNDSIEIEKSIEQKRQELKELEEKKIKQIKSNSISQKKMVNKNEAYAGGPSPVFSMVQYF